MLDVIAWAILVAGLILALAPILPFPFDYGD